MTFNERYLSLFLLLNKVSHFGKMMDWLEVFEIAYILAQKNLVGDRIDIIKSSFFPLIHTAADFFPFTETLIFTEGESGRELCHNILINNDDILEETEIYNISLTSTDTDVTINDNTASLMIIDQIDGNFLHLESTQ